MTTKNIVFWLNVLIVKFYKIYRLNFPLDASNGEHLTKKTKNAYSIKTEKVSLQALYPSI